MRAASAVLAAAGVLAALAAAVLWTAGSVLLDEDRFTERTVAALRAPEGQAAIAARVTALARAGAPAIVPPALIGQGVDRAVAAAVARPAFATAAGPAIRSARRRLLEQPGEPATIDLAAMRELVGAQLAGIDPRLAGLLPPAGAAGPVRVQVATGPDLRGVPVDELSGRAAAATALLALAAAALIALAAAMAPRPARAVALAGAGLVAAAAVPAVLRLALPPLAEDRVAPPDDALAGRLVQELLAGWVAATAILAGAGLALLVAGLVSARRRRPPSRRRAG
jgi:hypothetical protein